MQNFRKLLSGSRKIIQTNRQTDKQNWEIDKRTKGISQDSYFVGPKKGYSPFQSQTKHNTWIHNTHFDTLVIKYQLKS